MVDLGQVPQANNLFTRIYLGVDVNPVLYAGKLVLLNVKSVSDIIGWMC